MATGEVIQLGNPVLRQVAKPVAIGQDPNLQPFIDRLLMTVKESNGVGLAAPQMGASLCLLVVASRPNPRYPNAPEMEPIPMINPRIVSCSEEQVKGWEGCLSVPGIRGLVPRHQTVVVEYYDRAGQLIIQELTGFVARIFQHEYDHLQGLVFLDRVESTQDLMTEHEYQQQIIL